MLRLYDTRLRRVAAIEPVDPSRLVMYSCGPTVYRDAHVGNLRTFLLPDLIRRTAHAAGLEVVWAQNITDVGHMLDDRGLGAADEGLTGEDRLLRSANETGASALDIARRYEASFRSDCDALGIARPQFSPRASECIDDMVGVIERLIDLGHAYVGGDGSVFFDARSFSSYGAISGNKLDALRAGHRFEGGVDPAKRFHADWALWKSAPATRTQLVWDASVGRGFPGWHIECSAMLLRCLGSHVDIHTGGIDLRFPHHEDERAQTDSVAGHEVVRHWIHAEHLLFEGRKMSKSAGNVVLLRDVTDRGYDPKAVRLAFLQQHYRSQVDLSWDGIAASDRLLARWRESASCAVPQAPVDGDVVSTVLAAFNDDLDTPAAVMMIREYERNRRIDTPVKAATLLKCDELLGLGLDVAPRAATAVPEAVQTLVDEREVARHDRDWERSDALRDEIAELGWDVVDGPEGQSLRLRQR